MTSKLLSVTTDHIRFYTQRSEEVIDSVVNGKCFNSPIQKSFFWKQGIKFYFNLAYIGWPKEISFFEKLIIFKMIFKSVFMEFYLENNIYINRFKSFSPSNNTDVHPG